MKSSRWLKSPTLFISFSLVVGVVNFLDTFARLMYSFMVRAFYPLDVYLKPVFFFAQMLALTLFIIRVRFVQNPIDTSPKLSRFFDVQMLLAVLVLVLYVDFQLFELARISTASSLLQLLFYLSYLVALSGTSFWFAFQLYRQSKWRWLSIAFVLIGLAFTTAFLEPMFFWTQNYIGLTFPSQVALISTYTPHVLMFLAAVSTVAIVLSQTSVRGSPLAFKLTLILFIPAFLLPLLWDGYKDGLINFIIRDIFYWSFGYSGYQWFSVSFYLLSIVAYIVVLRTFKKASDRGLPYMLIILGAASLPWNGVTPLKVGYSSIPGNVISLSAVITGASLLKNWRA